MHTDKPQSLSIRDYIIRRLSYQLRHPENIISSVIAHQYSSAAKATYEFREVEISGLGKFLFSDKKAEKRLYKLEAIRSSLLASVERSEGSDQRADKVRNMKISSVEDELNYIRDKIDKKRDDNG